MFETIEKELETQFSDLLSIVNDVDGEQVNLNYSSNHQSLNYRSASGEDLDVINSQLSEELNEKLQSIEQVKEELDEELRKRDSLVIEFDKLDQNGCFSNESTELLDLFEKADLSIFSKNNCGTIEEKDENPSEDEQTVNADGSNQDAFTNSSFFNLSRTNLNSVLEEDENEESQNDDLIELNDLNNELTLTDHKELNNNQITDQVIINDRTLSPKMKRNSMSTNDTSILNDSTMTHKDSHKNSITSSNISSMTIDSTISSSTTTSAINSIHSNAMTRNESVLNLENLNSETNILVNNIVKKGVLQVWQQSKFNKGLTSSLSTNSLKNSAKRIFFSIGTNKLRSWKSRYLMLTENYLLCFKKGNKSDLLTRMGKFQFKLNLLDDVRSLSLNQSTCHGKSYSIDVNDGMMYLFDKDYTLLKEWYDLLVKTRQRCEMMRQDQEIKFRKEKYGIKQKEIKEILSERIERRKLIVSNVENRRESLLDKFSEKYLDKSMHHSSGKLSTDKTSDKKDDDYAFEYMNNLRQRLSGATSVTELNRSVSNLAQVKTNTPIISNRKRMSLQRKSLLYQFDSFLGSPLSHSLSKQQIHQQPQDNLTNLTNLASLTANASSNNNNPNQDNQNQRLENIESPTMLPRIAPQCRGNVQLTNGQLIKSNKQLTNSCSVFHLGTTNNTANSPFTINNSPALAQRSLYAERILSNSSLTLSNLSRFTNSRNSTLSAGTSFSQSLFKPFRESIHYATSLRKDNNIETKSHLKSATSEFSFIRLTNSSNNSTLTKSQMDDDTLKRTNAKSNFNRMHSFANNCSEFLDSEQDLTSSTTDYNSDTLRNELKNSNTITNLNSELANRTLILNPADIGIEHLTENYQVNDKLINHRTVNLMSNQMNNKMNQHKYQKLKKINNSLDESDSTFSSSNSSSCSSSNYHSIHQRQSGRINSIDNLKSEILSYSPSLNNHSPRLIHSRSLINSPNLNRSTVNSPLLNQLGNKKNSSKNSNQTDHTYQKVNNGKRPANRPSTKTSNVKVSNGNKSQTKRKHSSIPVSNRTYGSLNEPIYQSTEKRKRRMNRILENQSKIYVTMSDLK